MRNPFSRSRPILNPEFNIGAATRTLRGQPLRIAYLTEMHYPVVAHIEKRVAGATGFPPMTQAHIHEIMNRKVPTIGWAARVGDAVLGYTIIERYKFRSDVIALAVDPSDHRAGIGTALLEHLLGRLGPQHCTLRLDVHETNLAAQRFLRASRIPCKGIVADAEGEPTIFRFEAFYPDLGLSCEKMA